MRLKSIDQLIKDREPLSQVIILVSTARLMISPINYVNPYIMKHFSDNKEVGEIFRRLWSLYGKLRYLRGTIDPFI